MVQLFGITSAWGLPCISPFVTKVVYALQLKNVEFTLERQNLQTVLNDSPTGKLPYILFKDGERLADSSAILARLAPDLHLSPEQTAFATAVERMLDEHTYWHIAVEPRWLNDEAWNRYRCILFGLDKIPADLEEPIGQVRKAILAQWEGCGLGRMSEQRRSERAVEDVRSIASLLKTGAFFFGDEPSNLDGAIAAMTAHMLGTPFDSPAAREAMKHPVLEQHLNFVRQRIG